MTRINSAIHPKRLTDEHLLAEHREVKRLPHVLRKSSNRYYIPKEFVLGNGHVRFFLDKMRFTLERYNSIREECVCSSEREPYTKININAPKAQEKSASAY